MPQGLNTPRLFSQLLNTGLQQKDNPLYQVIYSLIGALAKLEASDAAGSSGGGGGSGTVVNEIQNIFGSPSFDSDSNNEGMILIPGQKGDKGDKGETIIGMDGIDGADGLFIKGDKGDKGDPGNPVMMLLDDSRSDSDLLSTPYSTDNFAKTNVINTFTEPQIIDSLTNAYLAVRGQLTTGVSEIYVLNNGARKLELISYGTTHATRPNELWLLVPGVGALRIGTNDILALEITGDQFINSPTQPRCVAYNSGTQAIVTGTFTAVTFDSEDLDVSGMHTTGGSNSRITIPTGGAGLYLFVGYLQYEANATGQRQVDLKKNGTTFISQTLLVPNGAFNVANMVTWIGNLAAADYIELFAFQDSGGNLNVGSTSRFAASSLSAVKLW